MKLILLFTLLFSAKVFAENDKTATLKWHYGDAESACDDNKNSCKVVAVCKIDDGNYKRLGVYSSTTKQAALKQTFACGQKLNCYVYATNSSGQSEKSYVEAVADCPQTNAPKSVIISIPDGVENLRIIFE